MIQSDETLRQYLDGNTTDVQAAAIEAALASDPALERRLMALDPYAGMVADVFKALPGDERIKKLRATIPAQQMNRRVLPWASGAAIAASLAFGVVFGAHVWPGGQSEAADWRLEVARYQALYVPETVAYLLPTDEKLATELDRAAAAVGLSLSIDALANVEGLMLRRAQVLGFEGEALIQLAYTDTAGTPFALCIMPRRNSEDGAATLAGMSTYSWTEQNHSFIFVAAKPQTEVSRLASSFRNDIL
jgi:anti-sigma factor RsiW